MSFILRGNVIQNKTAEQKSAVSYNKSNNN